MKEELRESELKLRLMVQTACDAIISTDTEGRIVFWNNGAQTIFGYAENEILGKSIMMLMPERFREEYSKWLAMVNKTSEACIARKTIELYGVGKNGLEFPLELSAACWEMADEEFYTVIIRDILKHKGVEQEIKDMAKFASENPNPILRISGEGNILYANLASQPLLKEWVCGEDGCASGYWSKLVEEALSTNSKRTIEVTHEEKVFSFEIVPIAETGYVNLYGKDITEQRSLQEKLMQADKLASLGELSAGIAHEIKNPLAIILQGSAFLKSSLSADALLLDVIEKIEKATLRADKIVKDLLNFSRQNPPAFEKNDVILVLEETLSLVEHQFELRNIKIVRDFVSNLPKINLDSDQIRQVFVNILLNAADAMPKGGTITISIELNRDKNHLQIRFRDTGCGIPKEKINKVFDPFFSTKKKKGGTGLGLSVTKGIIERHNGTITMDSKITKGTSVIINLPLNEI